jgi:hypothetical protein
MQDEPTTSRSGTCLVSSRSELGVQLPRSGLMTRNYVRLAYHSAGDPPWRSMRTEPSHDRYRHTFNFGDFQFAPNWPKVIRLVLLGAEIMP